MAQLIFAGLTVAGVFYVWSALSGDSFAFWPLLWGVVLLTIPCFVTYALVSMWLQNRYLGRVLLSLDQERLAEIYSSIEAISDEPPRAYRLGRTGLKSQCENLSIPIGKAPSLNKWEGQQLILSVAENELYEATLSTCDDADRAFMHNEEYALVGVPRKVFKSGKSQNRFQYDYYLEQSAYLNSLIEAAFPKASPKEVLRFLFETYGKNGDFLGFDGCFIGNYPRWIQEPEFPICTQCNRRMEHLLEIGSNKAAWNRRVGQSYIFSCPSHPDQLATVTQWD